MRGIPSKKNKKNKKNFFENPSKTTRYAFAPIALRRPKRQKDAQKAPVFGGALREDSDILDEDSAILDEDSAIPDENQL